MDIKESGRIFEPNRVILIPAPGKIKNLFLNIFLTANFATCMLLAPLRLNFTCAVALKLVSTGPGQRHEILTLLFWIFNSCSKIKKLELKNFNTAKVQSMDSMFDGCLSIIELDVSNFDTGNVKKNGMHVS